MGKMDKKGTVSPDGDEGNASFKRYTRRVTTTRNGGVDYESVLMKHAHLEYMDMNPRVLQAMLAPPLGGGSTKAMSSSRILLAKQMTQRFIIKPHSRYKITWDVAICIAALFEAFLTPLEVSFHVPLVSTIQVLRRLGDAMFIVDLFLGFTTSCVDVHGQEETSHYKIAKHYLRGWFVLDFFASIPFDIIMSQTALSTNIAFKIFKIPRILRLVKVGRVFLEMLPHVGLIGGVLQLGFFMYLLTHWCAAAFVQVVQMSRFSIWEQQHYVTLERGVFVDYAVYMFATIEVFLGVANPTTTEERWFSIGLHMVGLVLQAIVLGEVTLIIHKLSQKRSSWKYLMSSINGSMKYMDVPEKLQTRVRAYFAFSWAVYGGDDTGNQWLNQLSDSLHSDVRMHSFSQLIESVPMFSGVDDNFLRAIVMALKSRLYLPGDHVIRHGVIGKELFICDKGFVQALDKEEIIQFSVMGPGSFFGEIALLSHDSRRTAVVRAITYAQLSVLLKEDFDMLLLEHPDDAAIIERLGEDREKHTKNVEAFAAKKQEKRDRQASLLPSGQNDMARSFTRARTSTLIEASGDVVNESGGAIGKRKYSASSSVLASSQV